MSADMVFCIKEYEKKCTYCEAGVLSLFEVGDRILKTNE